MEPKPVIPLDYARNKNRPPLGDRLVANLLAPVCFLTFVVVRICVVLAGMIKEAVLLALGRPPSKP